MKCLWHSTSYREHKNAKGPAPTCRGLITLGRTVYKCNADLKRVVLIHGLNANSLKYFLIYIEYTVTNFLMRHKYSLSPISYSSLTEELHISHLTAAATMGVIPWIRITFVTIGLRLFVVIKNTFSWKDTSTPPHHVHCSIIYNSPEQPVPAHEWVDKENIMSCVCVYVHTW